MKKKLIIFASWATVIACMAVIFCLSHQTADNSQSLSDDFAFQLGIPFGSFVVRKLAHFLEFAGLCTLIVNALFSSYGRFKPVFSFLLTAVYAASDEIHQLFVEGRACRLFDWFVDCSGALCALLCIYLIIFILRKTKRRSFHD